jgi:hypothetical protein
MFGIGNRGSSRAGRGGVFSGGALRRAAIAGLGMLALRWWRNRQAGTPPTTGGSWSPRDGAPVSGSGVGTGSGQVL